MYTRNILIKLLTVKNVIDTVINARSTPDSIMAIIIGAILVIMASLSKKMIGDAKFYSSYFEGDLDGYVEFDDLAEVTGKKAFWVKVQLYIFKLVYMKRYKIEQVGDAKKVVLDSKVCRCECRKCGAPIDKRVYFTGQCSYCGSSDLFARVMTGNRFYSIENSFSRGINNPGYYASKSLEVKKVVFVALCAISAVFSFISGFTIIDNISKYNDKEYLIEVLLSGESYSSFELIKAEIMDTILLFLMFFVVFFPLAINRFSKIRLIFMTSKCSTYFSKRNKPFINIEKMSIFNNVSNKNRVKRRIRKALRMGYLKNCTFEMHNKILHIALAKKIVRDTCPFCGGPIIGAVNENYRCKYCTSFIMGVVAKK